MASESFIGVLDMPINPEVLSMATLSIPSDICLESISIPATAVSYITEMEFTFLLDGEKIWTGSGTPQGIEFIVPDYMSFDEDYRTLMVLAMPASLLSIPLGLNTAEITIAIKGYRGECSLMVETDEIDDFTSEFTDDWL